MGIAAGKWVLESAQFRSDDSERPRRKESGSGGNIYRRCVDHCCREYKNSNSYSYLSGVVEQGGFQFADRST